MKKVVLRGILYKMGCMNLPRTLNPAFHPEQLENSQITPGIQQITKLQTIEQANNVVSYNRLASIQMELQIV